MGNLLGEQVFGSVGKSYEVQLRVIDNLVVYRGLCLSFASVDMGPRTPLPSGRISAQSRGSWTPPQDQSIIARNHDQ